MNLGRALSVIAICEANIYIGESCDAEFDGGEFSGPAWAKMSPPMLRLARRKAKSLSGLSRRQFNKILDQRMVSRSIMIAADRIVHREMKGWG